MYSLDGALSFWLGFAVSFIPLTFATIVIASLILKDKK